jgi:hypothetical protein
MLLLRNWGEHGAGKNILVASGKKKSEIIHSDEV